MKPARAIRLVIGLVAFLAVGWAQAVGIHRGYMCECDCCGDAKFTQVDHCHGPHSPAGNESEDHSMPHQHDEDDSDSHHHAAVADPLLAMQHDASDSIVAPLLLVGTVEVCVFDCLTVLRAKTTTEEPSRRCRTADEWPRRLAQVIALRI